MVFISCRNFGPILFGLFHTAPPPSGSFPGSILFRLYRTAPPCGSFLVRPFLDCFVLRYCVDLSTQHIYVYATIVQFEFDPVHFGFQYQRYVNVVRNIFMSESIFLLGCKCSEPSAAVTKRTRGVGGFHNVNPLIYHGTHRLLWTIWFVGFGFWNIHNSSYECLTI